MKMRHRLFMGALLLALLSSRAASKSTEPRPVHAPGAATLRVGLWTLWRDKEISITPQPGHRATMQLCPQCQAEALTGAVRIAAAGDGLLIGARRTDGLVLLNGSIQLEAHGEKLAISYPLRISAHSGALLLSVTLPVESYVERVVASESSSADSGESLRALAIVVRSFALHQSHGHAEYDLCDSTHCQFLHWNGVPNRQNAAHAATLATVGETLWFHGRRAAAWFHQDCGGRTADPNEVWQPTRNDPQMPWLTSHPDNYCTARGAREWSASLSLAELTSALAAQGLARPGWKNLAVARRGESGRAVTLRLDQTEIAAEDFRLAVGRALGWNRILSTWFEVSRQGDLFLFHGRGSGHGVGLCQNGAAEMAHQGLNHGQILAQYFPAAQAADEVTGVAWQSLAGNGFELQTLEPADATYLPAIQQALDEAERLSGLQTAAPLTMRAFRSTHAFRDGTLAPGWVAAFTEAGWIGTQPLRTLAARKMLASVLRHELLHALVESRATAKTPLRLREGLAEAWSGDAKLGQRPSLTLDLIDTKLAHPASEAESEAAHRAAGWYAQKMLDHYGRTQVLEWLRSGVPQSALTLFR